MLPTPGAQAPESPLHQLRKQSHSISHPESGMGGHLLCSHVNLILSKRQCWTPIEEFQGSTCSIPKQMAEVEPGNRHRYLPES